MPRGIYDRTKAKPRGKKKSRLKIIPKDFFEKNPKLDKRTKENNLLSKLEYQQKETEYYKLRLDEAYVEVAQSKERLANFQEAVNVLARVERLRVQEIIWNNGKVSQEIPVV